MSAIREPMQSPTPHQLLQKQQANKAAYSLPASAVGKLLPMIANCVDRMKANGVAAAGDFSIAPPKPPIATAAGKSDVAASETSPAQEKLINVTGTGFVVSSDGHIVTNNHVISECVGDVHGDLVGESAAKLRVVSTDETNDLALLQGSRT